MSEQVMLAIVAVVGAACGYVFKLSSTFMSRDIGEHDLLARIDKMNSQMIEMVRENAILQDKMNNLVKENADLRTEIISLKNEIQNMNKKRSKK